MYKIRKEKTKEKERISNESYNHWYCKRERELHFSEIKYSFIKHRLKEDSSKSLF